MLIPSISQVINYHPLTATAETAVEDIIISMSSTGSSCVLITEKPSFSTSIKIVTPGDRSPASPKGNHHSNSPDANLQYLGPVIGIFTEGDLVQLASIGAPLSGFPIAQIMIRSIVTAQLSEIPDIFALFALFEKHKINHLPIVDNLERLIGLITGHSFLLNLNNIKKKGEKSILSRKKIKSQQKLSANQNNTVNKGLKSENNLLKNPNNQLLPQEITFDSSLELPGHFIPINHLEKIHESQVIQGSFSLSIKQITQLMSTHNVSYVLIIEATEKKYQNETDIYLNQESSHSQKSIKIIGTISSRDIVQLQALKIDFNKVKAGIVCNKSPIVIGSDVTLELAVDLIKKKYCLLPLIVQNYIGKIDYFLSPTKVIRQILLNKSLYQSLIRFYSYVEKTYLKLHQANKKLKQYTIEQNNLEKSQLAAPDTTGITLKLDQDGIWDWNIETGEIFYSTLGEKMLGYTEHEISHKISFDEWLSRIHPEDRDKVNTAIQEHLTKKNTIYKIKYRIQVKDNNFIWLFDSGQTLWKSGKPVRMVGIFVDITKEKETEIKQSFLVEKHIQIINNLSEIVWETDIHGNLIFLNQAWEKITGFKPKNSLGKNFLDYIHPEDINKLNFLTKNHPENTELAIIHNKLVADSYQLQLLTKTGGYCPVKMKSTLVFDRENKVTGIVSTLSNISEDIATQQQLQASQKAIKELYEVTTNADISFESKIVALLEMGCHRFGMDIGLLGQILGERYKVIAAHLPENFLFGIAEGDIFTLEQTFDQEALQYDEPFVIESAKNSQWRHHPAHTVRHVESYIGTKILASGIVYGTLSFSSRLTKNKWSSIDIEVLKLMANYIGGELLREDERKALENKYQHFLLLKQITQEICSKLDTKEIFQTTVTQIGRAFKVSRCLIHSYVTEPDLHLPCMAEYLETNHESILGLDLIITSNYYTEKLLGEDRAIASPDVFSDPLLNSDVPMYQKLKVRSILAIRTSYQGKPNGIIHLHQCDYIRQWKQDEINLLEEVASQVGLTLAKAQILESEVTHKEELEAENQALEKAREVAEVRNRAQGELLAMMSHKSQTNMNDVMMMTSLLLSMKLTPKQRDFVKTILARGDVVINMINNILDFTKIKSGEVELELSPLDIRGCVEDVLKSLDIIAKNKKLELAYLIDKNVPRIILTDDKKLVNILFNLLKNSINFTKTGEIVVYISAIKKSEKSQEYSQLEAISYEEISDFKGAGKITDNYEIQFAVKDTGTGIPLDQIDHLFKDFSQVSPATNREYDGLGLGLVISQRLSQMMGGQMWVVSQPLEIKNLSEEKKQISLLKIEDSRDINFPKNPINVYNSSSPESKVNIAGNPPHYFVKPELSGRGSIFYFTIQAKAIAMYSPEIVDGLLRGKKILVVESNIINQEEIKQQVKQWEMIPIVADSAAKALSDLEQGKVFDLGIIAMDISDMDGLTLARKIRKLEAEQNSKQNKNDKSFLPLLMLNYIDTVDISRELQEAKVSLAGFLNIPIKQSQFYNVLLEVFGTRKEEEVNDKVPSLDMEDFQDLSEKNRDYTNIRILLAENNVVNQKVVIHLLEKIGYLADVAANKVEFLDALKRISYDVVLMDVQMNNGDGIGITNQICQRYSEEKRPWIIAMTANARSGDREKYLNAGMDDYMTKPVDQEKLVEVLNKFKRIRNQKLGSKTDLENAVRSHSSVIRSTLVKTNSSRQPVIQKPSFTNFQVESTSQSDEIISLKSTLPIVIPSNIEDVPETKEITMPGLDLLNDQQLAVDPKIIEKFCNLYYDEPDTPIILIQDYLTDGNKNINMIRNYINKGNFNALKTASQKFKTSSALLGAINFSKLCEELEKMALAVIESREDFDLEKATKIFLQSKNEWERVQKELSTKMNC